MPTIVRAGVDDDGKTVWAVEIIARDRRRGTFADPRRDELERRVDAQHERGYEQRCRDDEDARVARGETSFPKRCETKAVKSDGA